ncbi:MAG: TRAP transporter substrate-binding protein [bacterium]|nr:TRAP transporter substrate-binding protein [bacterium]
MTIRKSLFTALGVFCAAMIICCSCSSPASAKVYKLKAGHVLAAESMAQATLQHFAKLVKERTKGDVIITIYPAGQLGNEKDLFEGLMIGSVDFVSAGVSAATSWVPEYNMFDLPLIFDNEKHLFTWFKSKEGAQALKWFEKCGIIGLGWSSYGFFHIISNKRPFDDVAKIKGMQVRCLESSALMAPYKYAGANPVAMVFSDCYTSLQNGTVDAMMTPDTTCETSQFYKVVKYLTMLNICPTACPITMSKKTMDSLPPEYQKIIRKAGAEACTYANDVLYKEYGQHALKVIGDSGVKIIYPTPKQIQAWRDTVVNKTYAEFVPSIVPKTMIDSIEALRGK